MVNKPKAEDAFFCYLGPTIRGVIQNGTLFEGPRDKAEEALDHAIRTYPRIRALLVSGGSLAADRIKVKTPGNLLSEEYRRFCAELKNKEG